MNKRTLLATLFALLLLGQPAAAELTFSVTYIAQITDTFTGRVYLMFTRSPQEPRYGPKWFATDPFYAVDVEGWTPGQPIVFDKTSVSFPHPLDELKAGTWTVQAVMRRNPDSPSIGRATGNAYSASRRLALDPADDKVVVMKIDSTVAAREDRENERLKYVTIPSKLLSEFHGRPMTMSAAVFLPGEIEDGRRYPTCYYVPGFSGTHRIARWMLGRWKGLPGDDAMVRVVIDPSCFGGHHVFADSPNNGPRGKALVQELIPHLEKTFPLVADEGARFLSGHSSGGWSSLWLQVAYPDFFGGTWSTAPDPVDFRDFQQIDLYADGVNMYEDAGGDPRPLARRHDRVIGLYRDMALMEVVYGEGGQLRSFEWSFSPRGADGLPRKLFDRTSGVVDPTVAEAWKRYDIRLVLENNWATLGPKLAGKLHVIAGGEDTFYLDGAARKLKAALERLGSDAVVEIVEGADHSNFMTSDLMERMDREMLDAYRGSRP